MTEDTSYDDIAGLYDKLLSTDPLFQDVLMPSLIGLIGPVEGQKVCDVACGQGWVARALAQKGARVMGIDNSPKLLSIARNYERLSPSPLAIQYQLKDVEKKLSIRKGSFSGAVCIMALMNIADLDGALHNIRWLLKRGGWLVIALTHPCYETPEVGWWYPSQEAPYRAVRSYFEEKYWKAAPGGGHTGAVGQYRLTNLVGQYHRRLSTYVNSLVSARFVVERMEEPMAAGHYAELSPGNLQVPRLLLIRARAISIRSNAHTPPSSS